MNKNLTSNLLPWIRSKEVIRLIADECNGDLPTMEERLLDAFAAGLIRCQAGSASFGMLSRSAIKRNWPVPTYIWQLSDGNLSLASDRFTAPVSGSSSQALAKAASFVDVTSLTLLELKAHEVELRKHFQLPHKPRRQPVSKSNIITACKKWLREEFRKDSNHLKRKDQLAEEAMVKFNGGLAKRGFLLAWGEVTMEAEHRARRNPGRPLGS
ncbi:MAG: hypothetical protein ACK4ZW_00835 [Blastomonas sp.]